MKKYTNGLPSRQAGFTLVELVIVIIIIGILAAAATIKMGNVTDAANRAANKAVLGMVKSAWSAAYAVTKTTPTLAAIVAQTGDPVCTVDGTTGVKCPVSWLTGGSAGDLKITIPDLATSAGIVCATATDCD